MAISKNLAEPPEDFLGTLGFPNPPSLRNTALVNWLPWSLGKVSLQKIGVIVSTLVALNE